MKVNYIFNRFNTLYVRCIACDGKNIKNVLLKPLYWLDSFVCLLLYGASLNDYFVYGFYKLRPNGKREFITYRKYHKIMRKCNDKNYIKYFRDKSEFNKRFAKYLHRDSIDLDVTSEKDFVAFFEKHGIVFVKEVLGFRGSSVKMYSKEDCNVANLYKTLKEDKDGHYIAEGRLVEDAELASFHPASVNTLRLVTVYDEKRDKVHIMSCRIRIGNKGNHVDNFHYAGIGANIDTETGVICSVGYDSQDNEYLFHPMTGKQILGFKIPRWEECKSFIAECVKVVPQVRYVGWDVVLLADGYFALIEANDNADHDFQQMHYRGMWKDYKALLKELS